MLQAVCDEMRYGHRCWHDLTPVLSSLTAHIEDAAHWMLSNDEQACVQVAVSGFHWQSE